MKTNRKFLLISTESILSSTKQRVVAIKLNLIHLLGRQGALVRRASEHGWVRQRLTPTSKLELMLSKFLIRAKHPVAPRENARVRPFERLVMEIVVHLSLIHI